MGTKLSNINLYNPERVEYDTGKDFSVTHIAEGWDTILDNGEGYDFLGMYKLAKKLSKKLGTTAVYTNYFDDSEFYFEININGSKKAYYQTDGGMVFSKGISAMVKALLLDDASAKAFRKLLAADITADEAIGRISTLSGLPLYLDRFMYDQQNGNISIPDKDPLLKAFSKAKKAEKSVKIGKKKLEVLQEINGVITSGRNYNYFTVLEPEEDGSVDYGHGQCYQIIQGEKPRLEKCHEYRYDLVKLSGTQYARNISYVPKYGSRDEHICISDYVDAEYSAWCNDIEKYKRGLQPPKEKLASLTNETLRYIESPRIPTSKGYAEFKSDRVRYYSSDFSGEVLSEELREYHPNYNDFWKDDVDFTEFGSCLSASDERLVRLGGEVNQKTAKHTIRVDFFDYEGNIKETIRIPKTDPIDFNSMYGEYTYIKKKNIIIANGYCIDLDKKEYRPIGNLDAKLKSKLCSCIVTKDSSGKELIVIIAEKTIYVLDMDLNILYNVSCGGIIDYYWQDGNGNLFMVTSKYYWTMPYNYKMDSVIKLQKLVLGSDQQINADKKVVDEKSEKNKYEYPV